jgi:hypothetical protein
MPMRTHPSARLNLWISLELISMFNSDLFTYPFLPFLNITSTVMVNTSFLRQGGMVALCRRPAKTLSAVFRRAASASPHSAFNISYDSILKRFVSGTQTPPTGRV